MFFTTKNYDPFVVFCTTNNRSLFLNSDFPHQTPHVTTIFHTALSLHKVSFVRNQEQGVSMRPHFTLSISIIRSQRKPTKQQLIIVNQKVLHYNNVVYRRLCSVLCGSPFTIPCSVLLPTVPGGTPLCS